MLIALFGGAFDPPHMGHYLAAAYYLACEPKGELWLLPSAKHPYGKDMAPFKDRARWCAVMAKMLGPRVKVSTLEAEIDADKSYTWLVVQKLQKRHKKARLRMLLGADAYASRARWYEAPALEKTLDFFPIGRGARLPSGHLPIPELSSSEVREKLGRKAPCDGLIPAPILADILKTGHYQCARPRKRKPAYSR